jgi:hypothetical protein
MPRSLSNTALASLQAQQTGEVWLVLLTITNPGAATIRVVNNTEDVVSRGATFQAFPFEIELPGEDPDSPSSARLRIDNVDKRIVEAVRSIVSPPLITIEVVLASQPDTVEIAYSNLTMRSVEYDAESVRGELTFESIYSEPVTLTITPNRFPGLF